MAEKEERIYIGKINWQEPLGFCPVPMEECNRFCEDCQGGMTRQEAIERMAEAICESWLKGGCKACKHKEKSCKEYVQKNMRIAEAALNALLEVEK